MLAHSAHRRKLTAFLKGLLDKITKHEEVVKSRKFYRCDEIFRETNEDETDESEEEIIGDIDEAFRERINSLIDISRSQKEMFFLWNSYIRRIQISYGIRRGLSNRDLLEHLYQFLKEPSLKTLRT
ncbi:MAG: hypothetical protein JST59_01345 [Actinobacteria bacterium]|nr:hypothetical protein [Actinomycetota bacterium]